MPAWPHAPPHRQFEPGIHMITAATLYHRSWFRPPNRLSRLQDLAMDTLIAVGWRIQAWAFFPHHYHVIGIAPATSAPISQLVAKIHTLSARAINAEDGTPGRKIWFQFWDSPITYHESYFARLRYVHENPVHHAVVQRAVDYEWCSAGWLEQCADPAYRNLLATFKIDHVNVYEPV